MALPQWTANFKEAAQKQRTPPSPEAVLISKEYSCGNIDSEAFFKNHAASVAEAVRLRDHCRAAAQRSSARNPEEKVRTSHFDKAVGTATAVGQYARDFHEQPLGDPLSVPPHLGHLLVPKPTITLAMQLAAQRSLLEPPREVFLPGALEPVALEATRLPAIRGLPPPAGAAEERLVAATQGTLLPGEATERLAAAARGTSQPAQDAWLTPEVASAPAPAPAPAAEPAPVPALPSRAIMETDEDIAGFGEDEEEEEQQGAAGPAAAAALAVAAPPKHQGSPSSPASSDESDSESEASGGWPPKPPLARFKSRMLFSQRFHPKKYETLIVKLDVASDFIAAEQKSPELKDRVLTWFNMNFAMQISTEFQFEVTFPVMLLTVLDAIYPRRVNWRVVDFRYQYKKALQRNYQVLEKIWGQVNMDKAREFRIENTHLRLENIALASLKDKLEFLWLVSRWYNQRFHNAEKLEPYARRRAIVKQCAAGGHTVVFPPWVLFQREEVSGTPVQTTRDTWRVCSQTPASVLSSKGGVPEVIASKAFLETFVGHQDGDWIMLLDEPGWIMRVVHDSREKLVQKLEKFRVVSKHEAPVLAAPRLNAKKIKSKTFGDQVFGYLQNDWLELSPENGFMHLFPANGSKSGPRVLESCMQEDYHKMPEFKRLIWFLGSPDHLTM